ncbi:MAG: nickel pincer cofactor biosynthesis protein LarC [Clostridium sp.]|nr:nickel pincer cofactor biosynthesis protein LarC [Clostridium sp.]
MKILYYDCFSGISGDMNMAAMIDLGVPFEYLDRELKKLNIDGYKIIAKKDEKMGITGTRVDVLLEHHHHHEEEHHHDVKGEHHEHMHVHDHEHRGLKEIESIINNSTLNDNVKKISMEIFMHVAKAEAKVHNKPLYEVHFHEVGAIDSIVDTVAAAIAFDYLKVDKVVSSSVELGGGFVKCAHGIIPVPAPAVVEIVKDIPVKLGKVQFETTTPTGAAILKTIVEEYSDNKNFRIEKTSYGIGHRDTEIPNVLRVFLAEGEDNDNPNKSQEAYIVECNIDDMNPEMYEYVQSGLFDLGAADVYLSNIIMKKGRPGVKLNVLCSAEKCREIEKYILFETTTLGVRKYKVLKTMLERSFQKVETKFGTVNVKNGIYNGKIIKSKPEYRECRELAKKNNVSINEIYKELK